jgi:hypothetical protein
MSPLLWLVVGFVVGHLSGIAACYVLGFIKRTRKKSYELIESSSGHIVAVQPQRVEESLNGKKGRFENARYVFARLGIKRDDSGRLLYTSLPGQPCIPVDELNYAMERLAEALGVVIPPYISSSSGVEF